MGNTVSYCIRIYIPISYAFVRIIQKIAPPITVNKSHAWMHEERDSVTSFEGGRCMYGTIQYVKVRRTLIRGPLFVFGERYNQD